MTQPQSLESKKQDLAYSAITRNLTTMTQTEQRRLKDGLESMPVHRIIGNAQYIENNILPQVQAKHGIESQQYKQFKGVLDSLVWCLHILNLQDRLLYQYSNEKLMCEFYREKTLFYERELQRYTTQEELLMGETMAKFSQILATKHTTVPTERTTERVSEPTTSDIDVKI
jgi:hypothetical protein